MVTEEEVTEKYNINDFLAIYLMNMRQANQELLGG